MEILNLYIQTCELFGSLNGLRVHAASLAMSVNTSRVLTTEGGVIDAPEEAMEGRAVFAIEESMKELMRTLLFFVVIALPQQLRPKRPSRRRFFDGLEEGQCQVFLQCGLRVPLEGGVPWMA